MHGNERYPQKCNLYCTWFTTLDGGPSEGRVGVTLQVFDSHHRWSAGWLGSMCGLLCDWRTLRRQRLCTQDCGTWTSKIDKVGFKQGYINPQQIFSFMLWPLAQFPWKVPCMCCVWIRATSSAPAGTTPFRQPLCAELHCADRVAAAGPNAGTSDEL